MVNTPPSIGQLREELGLDMQAYQSDVCHILQTWLFHHETKHQQNPLYEHGNDGHNCGYASSFGN